MIRPNPFPVVYRGTISGLQISAVNGTAFVDELPSEITDNYCDNSHLLEVYDSTGKMIAGVLKEVGSGRTYGSELVTNGTFDSDVTSWDLYNNALLSSVAGGQDGNCLQIEEGGGANPYCRTEISTLGLGLFSTEYYVKQGTASTFRAYLNGGGLSLYPSTANKAATASWNKHETIYFTPTDATYLYFLLVTSSGSGVTILFDSVSTKQVLTPSSSGAVIVSAKGGSTQNFRSVATGFTFNAASYTVIIKKMR